MGVALLIILGLPHLVKAKRDILTKAKRQVGQSQDYIKGDGYSRVSIYTRVTAPPSKGKEEYTALY